MNLKEMREFYLVFRALKQENFEMLMNIEDEYEHRFFVELDGCILRERQKKYIKDKILPLKRVCTLCKVKCKKCDDIIQTDKNQLLYCRCGSVSLDGAIGETYARIIGNKEDFEDLCEWEYEHTSISEEDARRFYQKFIKLDQEQIEELIEESQTEDEKLFYKDLWELVELDRPFREIMENINAKEENGQISFL